MTRFKDFTKEEIQALMIKVNDFIETVTMYIGTYVKTMNKICRYFKLSLIRGIRNENKWRGET